MQQIFHYFDILIILENTFRNSIILAVKSRINHISHDFSKSMHLFCQCMYSRMGIYIISWYWISEFPTAHTRLQNGWSKWHSTIISSWGYSMQVAWQFIESFNVKKGDQTEYELYYYKFSRTSYLDCCDARRANWRPSSVKLWG